ncbi:MAG: divergent polysaccharide deacetylase family protein [bacterium]|nr:divergent polysaccharide deacetylase family protein [bacterium]
MDRYGPKTRRARRLALFGLALCLLYSGCARAPRPVLPEPVKGEADIALVLPLHLDRRPVGPPNRLPAPELGVTAADADEAELLAQSAAGRAGELGAVVLSHEVRELPGRRELTMRFGPEGGPEHFRLVITWPVVLPRGPRLAIIIDDCGGRDPSITGILDLPVTPSVMPYRAYSRAVAQAAREAGREVMLHLPCEPLGNENPGPGALYTYMTDDELRRLVGRALDDVGPVDGVNNHMGSKLTSDRRCMGVVLAEISGRGLWFVDSVTYHTSVAADMAAEYGLPHARRDIFLDNDPARRSVVKELKRAVDLALERDGPVVVIGHDRDATLDAIREVISYAREAGVALVGVSQCLE